MATDLFAARGINMDMPRDLFAEKGINPSSPPTAMNKNVSQPESLGMFDPANQTGLGTYVPSGTNEAARSAYEGAAQSLLNYPIKIANLMKKNPTQQFDFAPHNLPAQVGGVGGDIGSFFLPGGAVGGALKGASYIPKVGSLVNAIQKGADVRPIINSLLKIGKSGAETGLYAAANNPKEAGTSALEGGGLGAGMQTAINLTTSSNPFIKLAARMGLGAGVGHAIGYPGYGALAGSVFPQAMELVGLSNKKQDLLSGLNMKDIKAAKEANDRLGTSITPGQASGNYVVGGKEGNLKRTTEGAQTGYRLEELQKRQQRNAINEMLDNIYQPTKENESQINALYEKANRRNLNPNVIESMKQNPILSNAFRQVHSDPAFTDIPQNNYKYLAEVDRQLFRDYDAAAASKPNTAHAINSMKSTYSDFIKRMNPDYEAAATAAHPKMVRQEIENKFNKNEEDFTGKNFYSKFLNTKKSAQDIIGKTKNFPEANQALKDMRTGWKHLSNMKTVSQSEAQSKTGLADARDQLKVVWHAMKSLAGSKKDIEGLKFIYSKDWDKELEKIMQNKSDTERNRQLATLFGKMGASVGLSPNED